MERQILVTLSLSNGIETKLTAPTINVAFGSLVTITGELSPRWRDAIQGVGLKMLRAVVQDELNRSKKAGEPKGPDGGTLVRTATENTSGSFGLANMDMADEQRILKFFVSEIDHALTIFLTGDTLDLAKTFLYCKNEEVAYCK